jgi:hypothetical protein
MANIPTQVVYHLKVTFPQERLDAIRDAHERFNNAQRELREAASHLEKSLYDLQNSLSAEPEGEKEEPADEDPRPE